MKTWDQSIHYPSRTCGRCRRTQRCVRLEGPHPEGLPDLVGFLCKRCFETPVDKAFAAFGRER